MREMIINFNAAKYGSKLLKDYLVSHVTYVGKEYNNFQNL